MLCVDTVTMCKEGWCCVCRHSEGVRKDGAVCVDTVRV